MADEKISAAVIGRAVIEGTLALDAPLLIGAGDAYADYGNQKDIHVLRDKAGRPFIPGTSIAGALRAAMSAADEDATKKFFGFIEEEKTGGRQSAIQISDVVLKDAKIVYRDGVSIDDATGTAKQGAKYDYEAVERGAKGQFHVVMTLRQGDSWDESKTFLRAVASRLASGVPLGALTAKGFGRARGEKVTVKLYDFKNFGDVCAWLRGENPAEMYTVDAEKYAADLGTLVIDAEFSILHSLIVRDTERTDTRSQEQQADGGTIAAFMKKSAGDFVVPGTSLKGALRHRAIYILSVLGVRDEAATKMLNPLMGFANENEKSRQKSRFIVDEIYFKAGAVKEAAQSRNRIDRFTGGTIDGALFAEQPVWQIEKGTPSLHIHFEIRDALEWEVGLALFLLKDLWTGHLPLGGDKAIGRGVLKGHRGTIRFGESAWTIESNGRVTEGDADELELYAGTLAEEAKKVSAETKKEPAKEESK